MGIAETGREAYERRVLAELRKNLLDRRPDWCDASPAGREIRIEAINHERSRNPVRNLVVIYIRDLRRPRRVFGVEFDAVEPVEPLVFGPMGTERKTFGIEEAFAEALEASDPEFHARVIEANLQELVCAPDLGLPHEREARGVRQIPPT